MKLQRQEKGYAMAVLLVALSVMAVMMTVLLPTWKHMARREKEIELEFRGQQYGRAIALYGRKYANALPPNIEVLIREHFLRKEFKDPITNDAFDLIRMGQAAPGAPGGAPSRGGTTQQPRSPTTGTQRGGGPGFGPAGPGQGPGVGGIYGVFSKSKEQSIRIYKGRTHYNEWVFTAPPQAAAQGPGVPGGGGGIPGVGGPGTGGRGPGSGGRGALPPGAGGPGFPPSGPGGTDGSRGRGPGFPGGGRGPGGNPFPFPTPPRGRGPGG